MRLVLMAGVAVLLSSRTVNERSAFPSGVCFWTMARRLTSLGTLCSGMNPYSSTNSLSRLAPEAVLLLCRHARCRHGDSYSILLALVAHLNHEVLV